MFQTIFVPLDGSRFGEHALPLALRLAQRSGAALRLVHVHVPLLDAIEVLDTSVEDTARADEQAYLDDLVRRLQPLTTAPVEARLLEGPVVASLEEGVTDAQASLVVMTTHGRGRFARFWLGSVADELVRHLTTPVLLVRPGDHAPELDKEPLPGRMVIALDGSPFAEAILAPATATAVAFKAQVLLLRIVEPPVAMEYRGFGQLEFASGPLVDQMRELHERDKQQGLEYLNRIAGDLQARGLAVETHLLTHDQPAQALLSFSEEHKADLIAVATHGRGGLTRLLLGSTADKIVRGAHVPVLVYRPPQT